MVTNVHRGFLTAVFMLWVFSVAPVPAFADHAWGPYHWARTSNPFTVPLGNNLSSTWSPYLDSTSLDWSTSGVLDVTVVTPGNVSNLRKCPPTSGRVEVCNYRYGGGWLGVAQIWINGGHIYQGTVKLNDSYFDNPRYPKYNSAPWRNLVMCQEVGHTFGLDHQDETFNNYNLGSCMDYTNYPEGGVHDDSIDYGPSNQEPGGTITGDSDYDELAIIYNDHLDSTTTVGQAVQNGRGRGKTPPALADTDSDEPVELGTAQWGKLIRSTNHGRTELYELDLGRGHKILTHVIWAEPEEEQPGQRRGRR